MKTQTTHKSMSISTEYGSVIELDWCWNEGSPTVILKTNHLEADSILELKEIIGRAYDELIGPIDPNGSED